MTLYLYVSSNSRITYQIFMKFYIGKIYLKFVDILKFCFQSDDDDDDNNSISNIDNNKTTTATTTSTTHTKEIHSLLFAS